VPAKLTIDVVTLFPAMFQGPLQESLIGRAREKKLLDIRLHSLRKWSDDPRHQKVDDRPFGGGAGMVIRPEPIYRALKELGAGKKKWVVYLSPQGRVLTQKRACELSKKKHLVLLCGHYEGIDERVMEWVDEEVSIGDYVLTGGELPAMVLMDAVSRFVPGVVGDPESLVQESFMDGRLDHPHYTRPRSWRSREVPGELVSGDHKKIAEWRKKEGLRQTKKKRPELLKKKFESKL
jgi:tRNA (guanine37-N1)-methyltransferase